VFNGKIGKYKNSTEDIPISESVKEAVKSLGLHQRDSKINAHALKYFLHQMSILTKEIESPFKEGEKIPNLRDILLEDDLFRSEYEIAMGIEPNYAARMITQDNLHFVFDEEESYFADICQLSFSTIISKASINDISEKDKGKITH